ncbi:MULTISPECIES: hypothetical protein [Cysteiniphilum]|uniref:Uncharacterized protein n=1 Tax=Cysteiniphilum litorale TaxID=2056700 RepID=A0A8J2Z4U8_9GAMM|nr:MULTISPECIES: hypothetical protein [Cysteiniphilum]GGF98514.1 hypothetical protein GCM10010995_14710 [Cysteiniphilum litorale]
MGLFSSLISGSSTLSNLSDSIQTSVQQGAQRAVTNAATKVVLESLSPDVSPSQNNSVNKLHQDLVQDVSRTGVSDKKYYWAGLKNGGLKKREVSQKQGMELIFELYQKADVLPNPQMYFDPSDTYKTAPLIGTLKIRLNSYMTRRNLEQILQRQSVFMYQNVGHESNFSACAIELMQIFSKYYSGHESDQIGKYPKQADKTNLFSQKDYLWLLNENIDFITKLSEWNLDHYAFSVFCKRVILWHKLVYEDTFVDGEAKHLLQGVVKQLFQNLFAVAYYQVQSLCTYYCTRSLVSKLDESLFMNEAALEGIYKFLSSPDIIRDEIKQSLPVIEANLRYIPTNIRGSRCKSKRTEAITANQNVRGIKIDENILSERSDSLAVKQLIEQLTWVLPHVAMQSGANYSDESQVGYKYAIARAHSIIQSLQTVAITNMAHRDVYYAIIKKCVIGESSELQTDWKKLVPDVNNADRLKLDHGKRINGGSRTGSVRKSFQEHAERNKLHDKAYELIFSYVRFGLYTALIRFYRDYAQEFGDSTISLIGKQCIDIIKRATAELQTATQLMTRISDGYESKDLRGIQRGAFKSELQSITDMSKKLIVELKTRNKEVMIQLGLYEQTGVTMSSIRAAILSNSAAGGEVHGLQTTLGITNEQNKALSAMSNLNLDNTMVLDHIKQGIVNYYELVSGKLTKGGLLKILSSSEMAADAKAAIGSIRTVLAHEEEVAINGMGYQDDINSQNFQQSFFKSERDSINQFKEKLDLLKQQQLARK